MVPAGPIFVAAVAAWGSAIQRRAQQGLPTPDWCLYDFGFAAFFRIILIPLQMLFLWGALTGPSSDFTGTGFAAHIGLALFNFPGPLLWLLRRFGPPRLSVLLTRIFVPWRARSCPREVGVLGVLESGRSLTASVLDSLDRELDLARDPNPLRIYVWARLAGLRGRRTEARLLLGLAARLPALLDTAEARSRGRLDIQREAAERGDWWAVERWGTEGGIRLSTPSRASKDQAALASRILHPSPLASASSLNRRQAALLPRLQWRRPPDPTGENALQTALLRHLSLLQSRAVDPLALHNTAAAWEGALADPALLERIEGRSRLLSPPGGQTVSAEATLSALREDVLGELVGRVLDCSASFSKLPQSEILKEARDRAIRALHQDVALALELLKAATEQDTTPGRKEVWLAFARLLDAGDRLCRLGDRMDRRMLHNQTYHPLLTIAVFWFNKGKQRMLAHIIMAWQYDLALGVADSNVTLLLQKNLLVPI